MKNYTIALLQLFVLANFTCPRRACAADVYVSPSGDESNDGAKGSPVASIGRAKRLASAYAGKEPVTVHVADGVYYLPQPIVFTSKDSGLAGAPVVFQAENEGGAVLSGGSKLDLEWSPYRDGIFQASTQPGLAIDQLFVDGINQRMARYPNFDANKTTDAYQGYAADAFSKQRSSHWSDPTGGYIHAMHRARWGGYHYQITGQDSAGEVTFEGGWQNNRPSEMHKEYRMVENIFEELDAPGEWFHDSDKNILYYMPSIGVDLATATVEVVRLQHLIEFRGTETAPVKQITLKGFVVRHSARTFMQTKEPMLRSDWAIYRGGAFFLTGTQDVRVLDCEFDQVGGNAIFASNYNRGLTVKGCHIHDSGASGVCFVGDPNAVRDPLFQYGQKNDLSKIDRTKGPKTNNYPADCTVEDCLIHGVGRVERQPAGVQIEMASRITVRNCSIYDCARAGINVGDGAWGGHLIEGCDVFDTVQETHDHGSFNSWGRDRYWRSDRQSSQAAIDRDPELPFLDAIETTVIRNNRFRCDHGWDIDLDDGSSNYDIYNNLCLAGGLKLREGFRRRAWNNITINNGFHPHVWYNNSGDEVWANIWMMAPRPARMPTDLAKGKRVDGNLYYANAAQIKDRYAQFGWDVNSVVADPKFVDPDEGDFRVQQGSPAFELGFKNFPMDRFGVQKASLKSIASTPVIPELQIRDALEKPRHDSPKPPVKIESFWLGATIESLTGQEFSAFGVSESEGGVKITKVPRGSDAAELGLVKGDLVQGLGSNAVRNVADLVKAFSLAGDAAVTARVIRDQAPLKLGPTSTAYVLVENAPDPDSFSKLPLQPKAIGKASANKSSRDAPASVLVDGRLDDGYGPVFGNGIGDGIYRMDLAKSKPVSVITTWSTNRGGQRGPQKLTLFGSNQATEPGWNLNDRSKFTPLGSIDTTSTESDKFTATSLRSRASKNLGTFRWIYWSVSPVTSKDENTAYQELLVQ